MRYIVALAVMAACFLAGYKFKPDKYKEVVVNSVKIDTLRQYYPMPYMVSIKDTIHVTDTVLYTVIKEYRDTLYRIVISGIKPQLESVDIYNRTTLTEKTRTIKQNKLGIGATLGYGVTKSGLSPALIVGVSYRIW